MVIEKELIIINEENNQERLFNWILKHETNISFLSENEGCGCCVDIFYIKCEEKIMNTFPKEILL